MRAILFVVALSVYGYAFADLQPVSNANNRVKQAQAADNYKNTSSVSTPSSQTVQQTTDTKNDGSKNNQDNGGTPSHC